MLLDCSRCRFCQPQEVSIDINQLKFLLLFIREPLNFTFWIEERTCFIAKNPYARNSDVYLFNDGLTIQIREERLGNVQEFITFYSITSPTLDLHSLQKKFITDVNVNQSTIEEVLQPVEFFWGCNTVTIWKTTIMGLNRESVGFLAKASKKDPYLDQISIQIGECFDEKDTEELKSELIGRGYRLVHAYELYERIQKKNIIPPL